MTVPYAGRDGRRVERWPVTLGYSRRVLYGNEVGEDEGGEDSEDGKDEDDGGRLSDVD